MRYTYRFLVLALCLLACLQAQDITKGSITGIVRDASGAVVPGATVKLESPFGDRTTTTNGGGGYTFTGLVVGTGYSVTVSQAGFSAASERNLQVGINQTTTADINLEVGTAAQSVDVTAASNSIDTTSTSIGANFDFIQEVQVQTGGFEAQYGEALGGIVNVVTKSGTNQFHGDIFGYFQPEQFEATRKNANPLLVSKTDYLVHQSSIDYGADAGGRILKDKLFWYGGFNPLINGTYKEADPFYANYALGVIDRKLTTYDYTGKIDYNLGTKHQFEGSVFGDPSHSPMTFNNNLSTVPAPGPVDDSVESKFSYGTRTWTGRYNGTFTPNWAVTVNYSNFYNSFTNTPLENGYQIVDNTAVQAGTGGSITYGGIGFNEASVSKVNQMAVSSNHIFR